MDKWFLLLIILIIFSSFLILFIRINSREELNNRGDRKLSADDFEILD